MKLRFDKTLSSVAFNFNCLRLFIEAAASKVQSDECRRVLAWAARRKFAKGGGAGGRGAEVDEDDEEAAAAAAEVGRCRLMVSKPVLKARLVSALETKM